MHKCAHLVELEKCCQTHILLQIFVLIQPRMSLPKICKFCKKKCEFRARILHNLLILLRTDVGVPCRWQVPPLVGRHVAGLRPRRRLREGRAPGRVGGHVRALGAHDGRPARPGVGGFERGTVRVKWLGLRVVRVVLPTRGRRST